MYCNDTGNSTEVVGCGLFFFIVYGPAYSLICLFGLIGNCLSWVVLNTHKRRGVANYLLKALAVVDNLFLITVIINHIAMGMSFYWLDENAGRLFSFLSR